MNNFSELRAKMKERIDDLPQRNVIREHVIDAWIEGVITLDPARALWHVDRLRGFGGSEAGELLRFKHGEAFYLQSPEDIIASKLLLRLPDKSNIHMARGTDLEEVVQRAFWQHTGLRSIAGEPHIVEAFKKPRNDLPMAVGNPDDVVRDDRGRVYIPDFKVRSSLDWESDIEMNYVAQCHWYAGILGGNGGIKADGLMLAELDIPNATADGMRDALKFLEGEEREAAIDRFASVINEMGLPGFGLRVTQFDYSEKLLSDLDDIASTLWEKHVLKGHPFILESDSKTPLPEGAADRLREIERDFLKYKMIKDAADEQDKAISSEAQNILREHEAESWEGQAISVKFGYTQRFDSEKAAMCLMADGVEKSELVKQCPLEAISGKDLDPDLAVSVLRNHGLLNASVLKPQWNPTAVKKLVKAHETLNEGMFTSSVPRAALGQTKEDKAYRASLVGNVKNSLEQITLPDNTAAREKPEEDMEIRGAPRLA